MRTEFADWYDTPHYYDLIFDQGTEQEADFLEAMVRKHGAPARKEAWRVLEPAAGSGRLMVEMARRGHRVSGFDLNERMLEYAREKLQRSRLEARLWQDAMEAFQTPRRQSYDLVHCLVSTFKYILDEEGARSHLSRAAAVLKDGGLYVLGLHLTDYTSTQPEHERWLAEQDGIKVVCNTHTWPPHVAKRRETLRTRLRITHHDRTWVQETHWVFRTYSAPQLKRLLRSVPELRLVDCYNFTYDLNEPKKLDGANLDVVLILRKEGA